MKKFKIIFLIAMMFSINYNYVYAIDNKVKTSQTDKVTSASDDNNFNITSKNVVLYNLNDNNVLYEKNASDSVSIASLTKIMTTIVAIENIKDLNKEIVITSEVFQGIEDYSKAGFNIGDKVTIKDLLYGIMLPSGADAVNATILATGKSKAEFIKLMNDKVADLGLKNTKFDNAIGMDSKDNYSSAMDVAKILEYALKNETFKQIYTTRKYTVPTTKLTMHSTLVTYAKSADTSNIKGAKSGFTDGAGLCLASIAKIKDVNYLLIVLGANKLVKSNAVNDSLEIYNYYAKNYEYKNIITKNPVLKTLPVKWGVKDKYKVISDKDVKAYLKNTVKIEDLSYDYKGVKEITYKNKKGDKLGTMTVSYDGKQLATYNIYLKENLKFYHPLIYTVMGISIVLMILSIIKIKQNTSSKLKKKYK